MTDTVFQQAFEAAQKSCSVEVWDMLTSRQITELVYQEMRRIDANQAKPWPPSNSASDATSDTDKS
ncbi:MAG: hypothetical protein ABSA58_10585 [Acetobacteraceae bacterium]|jgi:hypothetical protein